MLFHSSKVPTRAAPIDEKAIDYAKRALALMLRHGVDPTPDNYTVWYHYVAYSREDLVKEVDQILAQKIPFTRETSNYLREKYISKDQDRQILDTTAASVRELLAEIYGVIAQYTEGADQFHADLDQQMNRLQTLSGGAVEEIVQAIMQVAQTLKTNSQNLSSRLSESRKEVETLKTDLAQITTESVKDHLTGVGNRKALERQLEVETRLALENEQPLCILMVDIDHFKSYNDDHGHLIGDEVLKIVAKALTDSVRGKDFVARYGGEEFTVLLPNTPLGGAMIVAETIRKAIASRELKRKDTGESFGQLTVSIGVSLFGEGQDTIHAFIKRADDAMYRSKKAGRNRVTQETL